jgi:hypothetical protein
MLTVRVLGAGAAVAVGDAQGEAAAGGGAGVGVAVAEVLDEGLDRLDGGGGAGEVDAQVAAVCAAAHGADGGPAVADGAARHADLAGAVALVDDAELVFGAGAAHVVEVEPPAVEVAGVRVGEADGRVEGLQAGVHVVLDEGDGAGEVAQLRAGRAGQGGAVAEELLADLVGVVAAVGAGGVAAVDDREVAAAQVGDGGLVGGAVVGDSSLRWPSMGLPLASYSRM